MRKFIQKIMACLLAIAICIQVFPTINANAAYSNENDFIRGVDVSTLDMLEQLGAKYYSNGKQQDALKILKDNGANYVRLKLWVDPYDENGNPYGGGNNDYATTLRLAKRANKLGMKFPL